MSKKNTSSSSSPKNSVCDGRCRRWWWWVAERLTAIPFNETSINCRLMLIPFRRDFYVCWKCWLAVEKWPQLKRYYTHSHADFQHRNYMAVITVLCLTRILCVFFVFCHFFHSFFAPFRAHIFHWENGVKMCVWHRQEWMARWNQSKRMWFVTKSSDIVYGQCACFCARRHPHSHMLANKNMFQTNSLWKFILCRLWYMLARFLLALRLKIYHMGAQD